MPPALKWESMYSFWEGSRAVEYVKRISDTETEKRVAYEVSVSKLEKTLIDSACI